MDKDSLTLRFTDLFAIFGLEDRYQIFLWKTADPICWLMTHDSWLIDSFDS